MAPKAWLLSRKKILFLYLQCLSKGKQDDYGGCVASQQPAVSVPLDSAAVGDVPCVALPVYCLVVAPRAGISLCCPQWHRVRLIVLGVQYKSGKASSPFSDLICFFLFCRLLAR